MQQDRLKLRKLPGSGGSGSATFFCLVCGERRCPYWHFHVWDQHCSPPVPDSDSGQQDLSRNFLVDISQILNSLWGFTPTWTRQMCLCSPPTYKCHPTLLPYLFTRSHTQYITSAPCCSENPYGTSSLSQAPGMDVGKNKCFTVTDAKFSALYHLECDESSSMVAWSIVFSLRFYKWN